MKSIIAYFDKPLLKLSVLFGSVAGVLVFAFFLGLYAMGKVPLGNNKVLDFGINIIMMAGASWYYRKTVGKGLLHLWEALTICYVVNTIAAFIAGWLIYLFVTYIDPSLFTKYIAEMLALLEKGKMDQLTKNIGVAEYEKLYKSIQETKTSVIIVDEISKKTVMAIIPILVISLILRRQDYGLYQDKK